MPLQKAVAAIPAVFGDEGDIGVAIIRRHFEQVDIEVGTMRLALHNAQLVDPQVAHSELLSNENGVLKRLRKP